MPQQMKGSRIATAAFAVGLALAAAVSGSVASAAERVGTALPAGFPAILNPYLGVAAIGFGAQGGARGVPVIFLHGNNDSPFPTPCNPYGNIHDLAQFFLDNGYQPGQLWGLGYQGDQCDLLADQSLRSGVAHSTAAAVPLLRRFVAAVLEYAHASRVDIVAHSLGVTVAREWMLQDDAYAKVRALVAIDGPNHGIINCSPSPANYWQLPGEGGFTPSSAVCDEYGSDHTQLLSVLNRGTETPGPTRYLVIRNAAAGSSGDFVYSPLQDGVLPGVPAEDRDGKAHDFSNSPLLAGAATVDLTGQGIHDPILGTAHLGILNSPDTWAAALTFLRSLARDDD
jgi:hypothetical protein